MERLMNHFLVWSLVLHVCLELEGEWLDATVGAESILNEGAIDVTDTVGLLLALEEVIQFLDGTSECPLKE